MSEQRAKAHERRKHERIPVRFPVEAWAADAGPCRGLCLNLSAAGALLALPSMIPLGQEFRLVLELPDGADPVELRALPVRIDGRPGATPPFRIGVHFILAGGNDVLRIRSLIYEG